MIASNESKRKAAGNQLTATKGNEREKTTLKKRKKKGRTRDWDWETSEWGRVKSQKENNKIENIRFVVLNYIALNCRRLKGFGNLHKLTQIKCR